MWAHCHYSVATYIPPLTTHETLPELRWNEPTLSKFHLNQIMFKLWGIAANLLTYYGHFSSFIARISVIFKAIYRGNKLLHIIDGKNIFDIAILLIFHHYLISFSHWHISYLKICSNKICSKYVITKYVVNM